VEEDNEDTSSAMFRTLISLGFGKEATKATKITPPPPRVACCTFSLSSTAVGYGYAVVFYSLRIFILDVVAAGGSSLYVY
jgi:hypothetical protein